jgi:hypothetical protein
MPAEPGTWTPPPHPAGREAESYERLVGADAPRFPGTPLEVALRLDRGRQGRPGRTDRRRSGGRAFVTYVARSRVFGFPDAVSIRLHPEGDATRVDIFSRSALRGFDWGVNASRVARWIAAAIRDLLIPTLDPNP